MFLHEKTSKQTNKTEIKQKKQQKKFVLLNIGSCNALWSVDLEPTPSSLRNPWYFPHRQAMQN